MRCSEVKSNIALYSDEVLSAEEMSQIEGHLTTCPLCRQLNTEFQSLKNGLRSLSRPVMPDNALANLHATVAATIRPAFYGPAFQLIDDKRKWVDAWLMPSAIGTCASIVVGTFLLWTILFTAPDPGEFIAANTNPDSSIRLESRAPAFGGDVLDLTPSEYANTRLSVSGESPSINPRGALVALTRSLVRGEMKDEEVVVVADVFGNGIARIAEVVENSGDDGSVLKLERALDSDPAFAPFVPASFDRRSENMRVVLKIQNVYVNTRLNAPRRSIPDRRRS